MKNRYRYRYTFIIITMLVTLYPSRVIAQPNDTNNKPIPGMPTNVATSTDTTSKVVTNTNESKRNLVTKGITEPIYETIKTVSIPSYSGFKSYMGYTLFCTSSNQYKLQQFAETEEKTGLRMINNRYIIAVGSGVYSEIGQYVDLILENGTTIQCIIGDQKADCHTDASNLITYHSDCCSEFIVDMSSLNSTVKQMGDVSYMYEEWQSPVEKIIVYDTNYLIDKGDENQYDSIDIQSTETSATHYSTTQNASTRISNKETKID